MAQNPVMRGVDIERFVFFRSGYGRDPKQAYCYGRRLAGSRGISFRPLNFCYHTDGVNVWTVGGVLQGVDIGTFAVCDRGFRKLGRGERVPSGYAKDQVQVCYYGFEGRASALRAAEAATFESVGDCVFARDARRVFCRKKTLKKADPGTWRIVLGQYSRDAHRAFYDDREMPGVAPGRLSVHPLSEGWIQLAEAGGVFYRNDTVISEETYRQTVRKHNLPSKRG
jgi:hypothetical protein